MAEKLVPGIPHSTRIAILQQTDANEDETNDMEAAEQHVTALEQVMSSDSSRNEVARRMACKSLATGLVIELSIYANLRNFYPVLSKSFETDDPFLPVRAIRKIRHEQVENQLFLAQKNASLKSGARGIQARKDLKAVEGKVQASKEL